MLKHDFTIETIDTQKRIKIASEIIELNITMTNQEANELIEGIDLADWDKRKSIRAGTCLNNPVFWCINQDKSLSMLIGHDDENWEIGVRLSKDLIGELEKTE